MNNQNEVKEILRDYLKRSVTTAKTDDFYLVKIHERSAKLFQRIFGTVSDFVEDVGDNVEVAKKLSTVAADMGVTAYGHTSSAHQEYIALYTACVVYADDVGSRHVEALAQFSHRFSTGEKHPFPVLNVLAGLMKQSYDLWSKTGADAIISSTLMGIAARHLECTSNDMTITPQATWWPNYFRNRTGFATAYAHFNFMKSWRPTPDSYMQSLPYLEFFINSCK
uniref:Uncharacterized protein n=1 Tax=Ganoderma boninense TaxID=34458 RepID=A0A5K1K607_9APHY|nr:Uncharacterized protein [Ganoderma boninense]